MKKKTIGNKIMVVMMTLMLLLTGLGASKNVFAAANTADVAWSYNLNVSSKKTHYISRREKLNKSNAYVNWNGAYGGNLSKIAVSPYKATTSSSSLKNAGTETGGSRTYIMNGCGKYEVKIYVKSPYKFASIGLKAYAGKGTAKGVWSPDCAGSYKVLQ